MTLSDLKVPLRSVTMTPGEKALEALRLLSTAESLPDLIYTVSTHEGQGLDGPRVEAWAKGAALAREALSEGGIVVEVIQD